MKIKKIYYITFSNIRKMYKNFDFFKDLINFFNFNNVLR